MGLKIPRLIAVRVRFPPAPPNEGTFTSPHARSNATSVCLQLKRPKSLRVACHNPRMLNHACLFTRNLAQSKRRLTVTISVALALSNCSRPKPDSNAAAITAADPTTTKAGTAADVERYPSPGMVGIAAEQQPNPAPQGRAATTPTATVPAAGSAQRAKACKTSADCAAGLTCLFDTDGCTSPGYCGDSTVMYPRNCNIAIPLCGCTTHKSFYGPGGCAGASPEPWTLYACACTTDADCGGGQHCVAMTSAPHRPGATLQCQP